MVLVVAACRPLVTRAMAVTLHLESLVVFHESLVLLEDTGASRFWSPYHSEAHWSLSRPDAPHFLLHRYTPGSRHICVLLPFSSGEGMGHQFSLPPATWLEDGQRAGDWHPFLTL